MRGRFYTLAPLETHAIKHQKRPRCAGPEFRAHLEFALLSAILTGYAGFTTSAGYVGPQVRVDHDISMLVPEIWCRMRVHERDPRFMISEGLLERIEDFQFERPNGSREPVGVPYHHAVCRPLSRASVRDARRGVHRGNAPAGKAEPRIVRRRCGCHRGSAAARGAELFRGRQRGSCVSSPESAPAHHGARRLRRNGARRSGFPQVV